ncbi:MAG: hypothetical protein AAGG44_17855, partial [Planctomycetota bacterium]
MSDSQIKSAGSPEAERVRSGPVGSAMSNSEPPVAIPPVLPSQTQIQHEPQSRTPGTPHELPSKKPHGRSVDKLENRSQASAPSIQPALPKPPSNPEQGKQPEPQTTTPSRPESRSVPMTMHSDASPAEEVGNPLSQLPPIADDRSPVAEPSTISPAQVAPVEPVAMNASVQEPALIPAAQSPESEPLSRSAPASAKMRWYRRPFWFVGIVWDFVGLLVLLAVVAAVPLVQLASLGYLLVAGANLAARRPWSDSLPGLRTAGKMMTFAGIAALLWLPVWLVTDFAYSAQLLQPGSPTTTGWRIGAFVISGVWVTHLVWAAARGARWWHLLWPAPIAFL